MNYNLPIWQQNVFEGPSYWQKGADCARNGEDVFVTAYVNELRYSTCGDLKIQSFYNGYNFAKNRMIQEEQSK